MSEGADNEMSMIVLNAAVSHIRPELLKFLEWLDRRGALKIDAAKHSELLDEYFGIDPTRLHKERRLLMEGLAQEDQVKDATCEHRWQAVESGSRRYDHCILCGREKPR